MNRRKKLVNRIIDASLLSKEFFTFELLNIINEVKSYKKRKVLLNYYRIYILYNDKDYLEKIFKTLKISAFLDVKSICID
nr:MAG TPA: hypothetical protein [Caudoviricetes sp.]